MESQTATRPSSPPRPQVVIVGGGFGGIECVKKLDGADADVLLVDRNNYHLFTPLLYQVASSLLNPSDIAYPLRKLLRGSRNLRFRRSTVTDIDLDGKYLTTADGHRIDWDVLVLAAGSESNFFGNGEIAERSIGLKNLDEALQLRNHILSCLDQASRATDPEEIAAWLTFVIVGGGPTGVEYAGALAELFRLVLRAEYPELIGHSPRIVLVEAMDRLLPPFDPRLGAYAEKVLTRLGVEVMTGVRVEGATDSEVRLSGVEPAGEVEIASRTLVWAAGVRPTDLAGEVEAEKSRSRRLRVDEFLRLDGRNDVYAIGDLASVDQDGQELPMLSPPAMQAGRYVARRILAGLRRKGSKKPFRYKDKGTMAVIGRNAAVAEVGALRLTGFIGWLAWLGLHLYYLVGFRNRLAVMISWGFNYLKADRPVRLITRAKAAPLADA
ncbi:MAG: NAD(P)/FAD-dependent oxidoreductase [Acidobacteriota bacterium]